MKAQVTTFFIVVFFMNFTSGQGFDFERKAVEAKWESSTIDSNSNALPGTTTQLALGRNGGQAGIAVVKDAIMEDGRKYSVLHTHPRWTRNGTIKGWFPVIEKLPKASVLSGKIGFIKPNGAPGTDGARFMIFIHYFVNGREYWKPIFDRYKEYTGRLEPIHINLSSYAGQKVFFELRVDAGESSGQDWTAWVDTAIGLNIVVIDRFNTGELCPNTAEGHLVRGNRHFDGQVDAEIDVEVKIDQARNKILLNVDLVQQAVSRTTRVEANWNNIILYEAPENKVISSFSWDCGYRNLSQVRINRRCDEKNSSNYTYRIRLPQSGGEGKPFSYNDGEFKSIAGGRESPIEYIMLVGDTGTEDVSDDKDCYHDSKIIDIVFESLEIKLENKSSYDSYRESLAMNKIDMSDWKPQLNRLLETASLRLNNYTSRKDEYYSGEFEFYHPNDSHISLFGVHHPINIGFPIKTGPNEMYKMYVNDWNSRSFSIKGVSGNTLRLEIIMEDNGNEIIGKCHNNFFCGFSPAPSFNFSNTRIQIDLNLFIQNNSLDFRGSSKILTDIEEKGPCANNFFAMFCPSDRKSILKTNFENQLDTQINGHFKHVILEYLNTLLSIQNIDLRVAKSIYISSDEDISFGN